MNKRSIHILFLVAAIVVLIASSGCSPVISPALLKQADPALTFSLVKKYPQQFVGKVVVWSGTIIKTENTPDGTLFEILQHAADSRGKPINIDQSEGRFLALDPRFLDPAIYAPGRAVTIAGEIRGSRTRPLGEIEYLYPYLLVKEIYLWPQETGRWSPYDDFYYYDDPLWWRFHLGTGFYIH